MENIEAYYINLERSTRRKTSVEKQQFQIPLQRFDAIDDEFGELGCAISHLKLLESIKKKDGYTMIIEDDLIIINKSKYKKFLKDLLELLERKEPDAIVLAGTRKIMNKDISYSGFYKLESCNTTSGYIIRNSYIPKIIETFKAAVSMLKIVKKMKNYRKDFCKIFGVIDQLWTVLHNRDLWYIYHDSTIFKQKHGFSIIGNTKTDFKDLFRTSAAMKTGQIYAFRDFKWRKLVEVFQSSFWDERQPNNNIIVEKTGIVKIHKTIPALKIQNAWGEYLDRKIRKKKNLIKCFYINSNRADQKRIKRLNFILPLEHFEISSDKMYELSCAKTHLKILEGSFDEEYVLIIEEDFTIKDDFKYKRFLLNLFDFLENEKPDCVVLAGSRKIVNPEESCQRFLRLYHSNSTTGYVVKKSYIPKLIETFRTSLRVFNFIKKLPKNIWQVTFGKGGVHKSHWLYWTEKYRHFFAIDKLWCALQATDGWYTYNDGDIMSKKGGHVNNECGDFGDLFKTLVPMNSEEFKGYNEKKSVLLWDNIEKFFWLEEYYDNDKIIKRNQLEQYGKIKI